MSGAASRRSARIQKSNVRTVKVINEGIELKNLLRGSHGFTPVSRGTSTAESKSRGDSLAAEVLTTETVTVVTSEFRLPVFSPGLVSFQVLSLFVACLGGTGNCWSRLVSPLTLSSPSALVSLCRSTPLAAVTASAIL